MKILWLALICYLPISAQESFEVMYSMKYNDNLSSKDPQIRRHDGILRIDGSKSLFFMSAVDKHPSYDPKWGSVMDTTFIAITDPDKNELYAFDFTWGAGFLWVKDSLYPMKWIIDTATKKVADLNCTKARCQFRGRNYTAWFTNDIPISKGPWKFGGLPGLIVELEDDQQFFSARFAKISNRAKPVKIPSAKIAWKDFVIKKQKDYKDFAASFKAEQKADCLNCKSEMTITVSETLEKY